MTSHSDQSQQCLNLLQREIADLRGALQQAYDWISTEIIPDDDPKNPRDLLRAIAVYLPDMKTAPLVSPDFARDAARDHLIAQLYERAYEEHQFTLDTEGCRALLLTLSHYQRMLAKAAVTIEDQPVPVWVTATLFDIAPERRRQIVGNGFTPVHDDALPDRALATAAGCYCLYSDTFPNPGEPPGEWPFHAEWWKPASYEDGGYRRDLVKAGALILAEIDRLGRKADEQEEFCDE